MSGIEFFIESLKNLKTVGTVTRTSAYASREVTKLIDFAAADVIVELGSGDGAITKYILEKMKPTTKLFCFELNPEFCERLHDMQDMRMIIIEDSAEKMQHYLEMHNLQYADAIVSALPFAIIPEGITNLILQTCKRYLKPGGQFIQIHYSLARKKMYESIFPNIKIKFVWFNLPPLYVLFYKES